jgi:hypothetical protein
MFGPGWKAAVEALQIAPAPRASPEGRGAEGQRADIEVDHLALAAGRSANLPARPKPALLIRAELSPRPRFWRSGSRRAGKAIDGEDVAAKLGQPEPPRRRASARRASAHCRANSAPSPPRR